MTTPDKTETKPGLPAFLDRAQNGVTPANVSAETAKPAKMTSTPPAKPTTLDKIKAAAAKVAGKAKSKTAAPAKPGKAKVKPAKQAKPEADESDEPTHGTKSIVPGRYKAQYAATNDTCGSALSLALKEHTTHASKEQAGRVVLDMAALKAVAKANHIDTSKYDGLNNGQWRMNVYNRLVGRLNAGEDVVIGKTKFKAEDWTPTTHKTAKAKPAKQAKSKAQAEHHAAA